MTTDKAAAVENDDDGINYDELLPNATTICWYGTGDVPGKKTLTNT